MGLIWANMMGFREQRQIQQHLHQQTGKTAADRVLKPLDGRAAAERILNQTTSLPKPVEFQDTHRMNDMTRGLHASQPLIKPAEPIYLPTPAPAPDLHKMNTWDRGTQLIRDQTSPPPYQSYDPKKPSSNPFGNKF